MDDQDTNICPICWDKFKTPKLLPCRHTFCVKCLQRFVKISNGSETLTCPMCRTLCAIPAGGVGRFFDNFFVCNANNKQKDSNNKCDMCKLSSNSHVKVCSHCQQNMCTSCAASHKKVLILSGFSGLRSDSETSSGSETENEFEARSPRRRDPNDVSVPFSLQMSLPPMRSNKVVSLVSSFSVDMLPDDVHQFINCICPISNKTCWVLPILGPTVLRYDISGVLRQVIAIHDGKIGGMVYRKDGSLLMSLVDSNKILKFMNQELSIFTSTGKLVPYGITTFPDGRVVVVGSEHLPHEDSKEHGGLQIFDQKGVILQRIGGKQGGLLFENPVSVAVSKMSSRIFVCDRAKRCIFILADDGTLLGQYEGGRSRSRYFLFRMDRDFQPVTVCADIYGNIIILDISSGVLHVLDMDGKFLGLVLTNHPEKFGHPYSLATDNEGKLWIGDNSDMKVRVFENRLFINNLEHENLSMPLLPFPSPLIYD